VNNPYEVLGVKENATDDEIKNAYRALARKYQADNYDGSPLSDIARQKMRELDMAYDDIMTQRSAGYSSNRAYSQPNGGYYGNSQFGDVREKINCGRIDDAETILDGIPKDMRNAEWYYCKGQIQQRRGWFDEAYRNYSTACRMEPNNIEYSNAFNAINNNSNGGYRQTYQGSSDGCSTCDICSGLICADCCCESMGGDLIPCY
jgi:molecular chaperone DnaJ